MITYPFIDNNSCSIKKRPISNIAVSSNPTTVSGTPKNKRPIGN